MEVGDRRVISVLNYKGGVGKTTTAIHLAEYLARRKKRTILFDGDRNQSSLDWANAWRGKGSGLSFRVVDATEDTDYNWEYAVIDTEARPDSKQMERLAKSYLMIVPTTPDAASLRATMKTVRDLQEHSDWGIWDRFKILLVQTPPRTSNTPETVRTALENANLSVFSTNIRRFTAFQKAAALGTTADRTGDKNGKIAWGCYTQAFRELEIK